MDIVIISAYYPTNSKKHSIADYIKNIKYFFESIQKRIIFFCSSETEEKLREIKYSFKNVTIIIREFESWFYMSPEWMEKWRNFHKIDPEHGIHCPEMYAIWASKQEFVKEVIKTITTDIYIWCDAGYFHEKYPCNFSALENSIRPEKITCLKLKYGNAPDAVTITAGMLVGDVKAWVNMSELFLKQLSIQVHGKEQEIYNKIFNDTNAVIIESVNSDWYHFKKLFG